MAVRAYLLAGFEPGLGGDGQVAAVRALEALPEVSFAEPVVGAFDLVVSVECEGPVEELLPKVTAIAGLRGVQALKARPLAARERMWRNLQGLPQKPVA